MLREYYYHYFYIRHYYCLQEMFLDSSTSILAHLSLGKPNIPELIADIETLLNPFSDASKRLLLTALACNLHFLRQFLVPQYG